MSSLVDEWRDASAVSSAPGLTPGTPILCVFRVRPGADATPRETLASVAVRSFQAASSQAVAVSSLSVAHVGDAVSVLSDEEADRAAMFVHGADRRSFVLAHAVVRLQLGWMTGVEPRLVVLQTGARGKPFAPSATSHVNLARRREVLAVVHGLTPVGVDVEKIDDRADVEDFAGRFFHPAERRHLMMLPARQRHVELHRLWVRKEAMLKAAGTGLRDLHRAVVLDPTCRLRDADGVDGTYHVADRPAVDGHVLAVSWQSPRL